MKILEINGNGNNFDVTVTAVFSSDKFEYMTACYNMSGGDEIICVYDGKINIEDPGIGPYEEYATREEALCSEFKGVFTVMFGLACSIGPEL